MRFRGTVDITGPGQLRVTSEHKIKAKEAWESTSNMFFVYHEIEILLYALSPMQKGDTLHLTQPK